MNRIDKMFSFLIKRLTKRKVSIIGYTTNNWKLEKKGIGIIHTLIWNVGNEEKDTKIKITIEEI